MVDVETIIQAIHQDHRSGAAEIARKAVDLLDSMFQEPKDRNPHGFLRYVAEVGIRIIEAQPSMAPLLNLVNGLLLAIEQERSIEGMREKGMEALSRWKALLSEGSERIAAFCLPLISQSSRIAIYSWSSTAMKALSFAREKGRNFQVLTSECRPGMEGRRAAEVLSNEGVAVTLVVDAALPALIERVDLVLVGADAVSEKGIVNKVGTHPVAALANIFKRPIYCLCQTEKFLPRELGNRLRIEEKDPAEVLEVPLKGVKALNLYFEITPIECFQGIVTEKGIFRLEEAIREIGEKRVSAFVS